MMFGTELVINFTCGAIFAYIVLRIFTTMDRRLSEPKC